MSDHSIEEIKKSKEGFEELAKSGIEAADLAMFLYGDEVARDLLYDSYPEEIAFIEESDGNAETLSVAIYGDGCFQGRDERPLYVLSEEQNEFVDTLRAAYLSELMGK